MKTINFNSNQFSYLSNEVKLAMDNASQIYLNYKPISFGADQKIIAETENVRNFVASSLNIKSHEVFFSNGNINAEREIIHHSILFLGVEHIITSKFENKRKLEYLSKLSETGKIELHFIETSTFGELEIASIQKTLSKFNSKSLISLSHANLYTGVLLPLKEIAGMCKSKNAYFHLDLSLTIGKYLIDLQNIKPDFVSFDCSLIHGPVGIGIQTLSDKIEIDNPIYHTLLKNFNLTESKSLTQILGFYKAYTNALERMDENRQKIINLKSYFIEKLNTVPAIKAFVSETKKQGLINLIPVFADKNIIGEYLIEKLDLKGISIHSFNYPVDIEEYQNHQFINFAISEDIAILDIDYLLEILLNFKI